ncbi:MAG: hypothetical protein QM698_10835 [Micropepsaceae bacterium]
MAVRLTPPRASRAASAALASCAMTRAAAQGASISAVSMPAILTITVTSWPSQIRTRASKLSPSRTRTTLASYGPASVSARADNARRNSPAKRNTRIMEA